jgi:hypothetical protein
MDTMSLEELINLLQDLIDRGVEPETSCIDMKGGAIVDVQYKDDVVVIF